MIRLRFVATLSILLWSCTLEVGRSTGPAAGSLAMSRDEALIYAVDTDNGLLVVFDTASMARLSAVKVGTQPVRVVVGPDDTLYVTNRGSRSISVIHRDAWQVAAELPTSVEPNGLAISNDGHTLYVVSATAPTTPRYGTLAAYDTSTLEQRWELPVGEEPRDVALVDEQHAVVTLYKQGAVATVNLSTPRVEEVSELTAPSSPGAAVPMPQASVEGSFHARGLTSVTTSAQGHVFVVGRLSSTQQLPSDGGIGYGVAITVPAVFKGTGSDGAVSFDPGVRGAELSPGAMLVGAGSTAAVVTSSRQVGSDETVFAIDRESGVLTVAAFTGSSAAPTANQATAGGPTLEGSPSTLIGSIIEGGTDGLAVRSDPGTVFTYSQFTHQLTRLVFNSSIPTAGWMPDNRVSAAPEALDPEVALGRRLFFTATDGALSNNLLACSSCHLEGRDDGHVWHLPQGLRQTPSLAGRQLAQTAPYHWQGELPTLGAFYDHTVKKLMGGTGLDEQQQQAMSKFLESLPAPENPRATAPTAADQRGRAAFTKAGCDACHAGAAMANNGSADVGTGGRYDVPSLLGVGRSAPYLHDGSAPTLEARFSQAQGDLHGNVSLLSTDELKDLISYLETL
jgi:YVTN family beta-propeller protein